jgi:hypothetical protein
MTVCVYMLQGRHPIGTAIPCGVVAALTLRGSGSYQPCAHIAREIIVRAVREPNVAAWLLAPHHSGYVGPCWLPGTVHLSSMGLLTAAAAVSWVLLGRLVWIG